MTYRKVRQLPGTTHEPHQGQLSDSRLCRAGSTFRVSPPGLTRSLGGGEEGDRHSTMGGSSKHNKDKRKQAKPTGGTTLGELFVLALGESRYFPEKGFRPACEARNDFSPSKIVLRENLTTNDPRQTIKNLGEAQHVLEEAAQKGELALLEELVPLLQPADLNWHNPENGGKTALHWAAKRGCLRSVKLLVAAGAEMNDTDDRGQNAVHLATGEGQGAIVQWLAEQGTELNAQTDAGGTALHYAALGDGNRPWLGDEGTLDAARALVAAGALLDLRDETGASPLCTAACGGCQALVRILVDAGAPFKTQTRADHNTTCLQEMALYGTLAISCGVPLSRFLAMARMLIGELGMDPHARLQPPTYACNQLFNDVGSTGSAYELTNAKHGDARQSNPGQLELRALIDELRPSAQTSERAQQAGEPADHTAAAGTCAACGSSSSGASNANFKKCARCLAVRYCSKNCQLTHWPVHKVSCMAPVAAPCDH
jgi:ankyrin repeat protein